MSTWSKNEAMQRKESLQQLIEAYNRFETNDKELKTSYEQSHQYHGLDLKKFHETEIGPIFSRTLKSQRELFDAIKQFVDSVSGTI